MRYLKVVLISMLAFIAGLGGILGVMYLVGAFNEKVVEPESIYFEKAEYNVDDDFTITILSQTPDVTKTNITLSLSNKISEEKIGGVTYLANDSIIIPKYVTLGKPFEVELVRGAYTADGLSNWILGGQSTITAKSESMLADEKSVDVNVDVPVHSVQVITKTADNDNLVRDEFAMGDTFIAEAKFIPSASKFKYSGTETKKVYFEANSDNNAIVKNSGALAEGMDENTTACFDALLENSSVRINAYVFATSTLEDMYAEMYADDAESYVREIKNNADSINAQKNLTFSKLVVSSFGLTDSGNTQKILEFNHKTQIFANKTSSNTNLGLVVKDSKNNNFQSQIKNIGLRVFVKKNNDKVLATSADIVFASSQTKVVGGNIYFMPTVMTTNVENSYWEVIAVNSAGSEFEFEFTLFDGDEIATLPNSAPNPVYSTNQVWRNTGLNADSEPNLYWASTDDINITFIDSLESPNPAVLELGDLIRFSDTDANYTNGTYRAVRYLAYSPTNEDLSGVISGATPVWPGNSKYSILNLTSTIYELPSSTLSVFSAGVFNVVAVVVISNYEGIETDEVFKYTTDKATFTNLQPIKITVDKTVQSIEVGLNVKGETLKNQVPYAQSPQVLDKLAFLQKKADSIENIFDIVFTVRANTTEQLKTEVALFVEAFESGKIKVFEDGTNLLKIEYPNLSVDYATLTGVEWQYVLPVSAKSLDGQADTIVKLKWEYEKTDISTETNYIAGGNSVNFVNLDNHVYREGDFVQIEIYDGLPSCVVFGDGTPYFEGYVNSADNPVYKSTNILYENVDNVNYATAVESVYSLTEGGVDIKDKVVNPDGSYILTFTDKYGNIVNSSVYDIASEKAGSLSLLTASFEEGEYSSSLTTSPVAKLFVYEDEDGEIVDIQKNTAQIGYDDVWVSVLDTYNQNNNVPIIIERYGYKNNVIDLVGNAGLIKFQYMLGGEIYELCNIINYNLKTLLPDGISLLNENNQPLQEGDKLCKISVNSHMGKNTRLTLIADTGLGITFNIQLTILPNIDATFEIVKEDVESAKLGQNEVYSNIENKININVKVNKMENFILVAQLSDGSKTFEFNNAGSRSPQLDVALEDNGSMTASFVVNFGEANLGENTIVVKIQDGTSADFAKDFVVDVLPNLKLATEGDTLEVVKQVGNEPISVLAQTDYTRIVPVSGETNINNVRVEIAETINGVPMIYEEGNLETPIVYPLFKLDASGKVVLETGAKVLGNYIVKLNLLYNGVVVKDATITLTLTPNITPNTQNASYSDYFKNFNGKETLILQSSSIVYNITELKTLFSNVSDNGFTISATGVDLPYSVSGNGIYVTTSKFVLFEDILTLKNEYTEINFPIAFIPVDPNFVKYATTGDELSAIQKQNNAKANADIGYANDEAWLSANNIFDIYKSGQVVSLFDTNYILTENNGTYKLTNKTPNTIYVVVHNSSGYFYKAVDYYKSNVNIFPTVQFTLTDLSTFTKIDNTLTGELNSNKTEVVGVFASNEVFNNTTKLESSRGFGLSSFVFEFLSANYSHNVRLFGEDGMELAGYIFDKKSGFVQFNNSTTDTYAFAKFEENSGNTFLVYRIFIQANSQINVYYPYTNGIASGQEEEAEYVYASSANRMTVDFNSPLENIYPNSNGLYRVMLQNGSVEEGFVNSKDYSISYSIFEVWQNGSKLSDREIALVGITLIDGVLSMPKTFNGEVVVSANVKLDSNLQDMGSVKYRVIANYEALGDYVLRIGQDDFTTKQLDVPYGNTFDFGNIELYKYITNNSSEGVTLAPNGFLKYHVYGNLDIDEYFDFDLENKTIAIKDNLTIVNDIKVNFVFYTIYGPVHTTELTFKSTIAYEYNTNQTVVKNGDKYEVLADSTFDILSIFSILDNGANIALSRTDYEYSVDGGITFNDGFDVMFSQEQVGEKSLLVRVKLENRTIGQKIYDANYEFVVTLDVKQSLKSNYAQIAPMQIGDALKNEITYTTQTLTFEGDIYTESMDVNSGSLFSTISKTIIMQYDVNYEIRENSAFVKNVSINLSDNRFSIAFTGAPKASTSITIIFTLSKGDVEIVACANFNLVPDLEVSTNYAYDNQTNLGSEAKFLSPEFVKGTGEWGGNYSEIALSDTNYFKENGLIFKNTVTGMEVNATELGDRLKFGVKSVGDYLVIRANATPAVFGLDIQDMPFGTRLQFQWNSVAIVTPNATESVVFGIYIDGIEVITYSITFYADMSQIFGLKINYLYDVTQNTETFFVENSESELIFSNKTALFEFQTRSDLRQTLDLEAYANEEKVGQITISGDRTYSWLLTAYGENTIISKSALSFKIVGDDEEYILASGSAYTFLFREDSIKFTNRVEISYMNKVVLSYEEIEKLSEDKALTIGENGAFGLDTFTVHKADESKIDKTTSVPFMIDNQVIGYYNYTLKYDIKITSNYESSVQPSSIKAGESAIGKTTSGLAEFGITRLGGQAFDQNYFNTNNVSFSVDTIMVTNVDFETNPTKANVRYYYEGMQEYATALVTDGIAGVKVGVNYYVTTNIKYIGDATSNPKYDFYIEGNGAEANGNIVYLLFKFYATGTDFFTYDILKVKVLPGIEYSFVNDELNPTTTQNTNTTGGRLAITYNSGTTVFDDIELANLGASKINIASSRTTQNLAVNSSYTYEVKGDIAGYVEIERTNGVSVSLVQGDKFALYGNKTGYILVTDAYGFEMRYYLELSASSDYALRLPDSAFEEGPILIRPISNDPNLVNFNIYEGTELQVVDKNVSNLELEEGQCAISVVNLAKIVNELHFSYNVAYRLAELDFAYENTTNGDPLYNKCTLPILTQSSSASGNLDVIITIHKNDGTSEVVTLTFEVQIIKRYTVGAVENASVRESVAFDVSNYISVADRANNELALGNTEVSGKTYTLVVDESKAGTTMNVIATPASGSPVVQTIIVGKNAYGVTMTPTGGKYYQLLQTYSAFAGLDLTAHTLSIQETSIDTNLYSFEKDIVVSLITSKISNSEQVYVNVNNGSYKIKIPFTLNLSGKQTKSVLETILASNVAEATKEAQLADIHTYVADAEVISSYDTQKIKNFVIYNDNLTLKIEKGYSKLVFEVRVYTTETQFKSASFMVANSFAHFYNISVSSIVGSEKVNVTYPKIELVYDYLVGDFTNVTKYSNIISFANFNSHDGFDYDVNNLSCTYIKSFDNFEISAVEYNTELRMYEDEIKILSASAFKDNDNFTNIVKYYLVEYSNDKIIVKVPVTYSVTPKYYRLDNYGLEQDKTNFVYINQYSIMTTTDGENYKVDFDVWASEFNLIDKYGAVLSALNLPKSDLVFDIVTTGSGSAIFNENYDLITAEGFNFDQFLKVAVKVKVNDDPNELVTIGYTHIQLSQSEMYVEVTGKYTVTINSPAVGSGTKYTINGEYEFNKNVVSIYDILSSSAFADVYDAENGTIRFDTTSQGYGDKFAVKDCEFAVVTVVDGIFSARANGDNLEIKLKINENQTSLGKKVTLRAVATKIGLTGFSYVSNSFDIIVNYQNGAYFVGLGANTFAKEGDYFTVSIPFASIFSQVFVPTDYNYNINIMAVEVTDFNILYTSDDVTANLNDTLFFNLTYKDSQDITHTEIIGLKYTEDAQNFGGGYGYSINISSLGLTDIKNYTVYFLGGFALEIDDGDTEVNLLVQIPQGKRTTYSIARVDKYLDNAAFLVTDCGNQMVNLKWDGSGVSVYNEDVVSHVQGEDTIYLPKYLNLNQTPTYNQYYYYGVYTTSQAQMQLFAVMANSTNKPIWLDITNVNGEDYSTANYINVYDFYVDPASSDYQSKRFIDSVMVSSVIQPLSTGAVLEWVAYINNNTINYTTTTITKTSANINSALQDFVYFDTNPLLVGSALTKVDLLSSSGVLPLDMIKNLANAEDDTTYYFELQTDLGIVKYFALSGSDLALDVATLLADGDFEKFVQVKLLSVDANITTAGTYTFALYNGSVFTAIKAMEFTAVGDCLVASENPLLFGSGNCSKATLITSSQISVAVPKNAMYYISVGHEFMATYYTSTSVVLIDVPVLSAGQSVRVILSGYSLAQTFVSGDVLNFYVDESSEDRNFIATDGTNNYEFTILAGETSHTIDLSQFDRAVRIQLVIPDEEENN